VTSTTQISVVSEESAGSGASTQVGGREPHMPTVSGVLFVCTLTQPLSYRKLQASKIKFHCHHDDQPDSPAPNQVLNYEDNDNDWASKVGLWAQELKTSATGDDETPDGGQCRFPSPLPTHTRVHAP
jgi:hypothetical protein